MRQLSWEKGLEHPVQFMLETTSGLEHAVWESGSGIEVEYSREVIEEVRRLSVDGFNAFAHGGKETGGVLYGAREGDRIRVLSFAALESEHARGPRFLLSEKDHASMAALARGSEEYQAVGWFRSHTRGSLDLDSNDRELFDRYFDQPLSVTLIVKPTHWGPASAAFFVRTASRGIAPAAAEELALAPMKTASAPVAVPVVDATVPLPAPREDVPPAAAPPKGPSRTRHTGLWVLCALALLAVVTLVSYLLRPMPKMSVQAYAIAPGQVRIEWRHGSAGLPDNASGSLQIADGASLTRIPMDAAHLRSGSMTYVQQTSHITVRMKVNAPSSGSAPLEDSVEFVGALPAPPPPPQPPAAAQPLPEVARQQAPPPVIQQRVEVAQAEPPRNLAHREAPVRSILPPARESAASAAPQVALPMPPPVELRSPGTPSLPDFLNRAPHVNPTPVPAPPPGAGGSIVARAGRLIWTGVFPRRGVIEIDGGHSSIGALSGALPGALVNIRVFPAEFTRDGLVVYTTDRNRDGKVEKPSQSNGWNSTQYRLDPVRARQVVVLEYPNRANEYKHLVLRNDGRECPVVLVDWSVE